MSSRTIHLEGQRNPREAVAAGTIKPGHLCQLGSAGSIVVHNVAGGPGRVWFAQENAYLGKTVDDAYSSGERVFANSYKKGERVNAVLKTGTSYTVDMPLYSAGNGTLCVKTALASAAQATAVIFAYVKEAKNLTVSGSVDSLVPVEIA